MTVTGTRWAAIGAALAVTLGAGSIGLVSATSPADAVAFVPIEPCRVADTRPAAAIGPRSTPLAAGDTYTIGAHGDNGDCSDLPATAAGLSLNVTALGATTQTFLTVWAAGTDRPLASSLNPAPGQPPTPNAVTTQLSSSGEFNIYNDVGSVHVVVDINGYYTDHSHSDLYLTNAEIDAKIAAAEVGGPPGPPGADGSDLFDRTIVVNGGGTPADNGAELSAAISQVASSSPSATDPWAVVLEPGVFELASSVKIPDHVTITGSGVEATRIERSSTALTSGALLAFGIGELRDLEVSDAGVTSLVSSAGSIRVESVRFLVDSTTGLDLIAGGGPHTIVDSEFSVTAAVNAFAVRSRGDVTISGTTMTALAGSSIELIGMENGDLTLESSTLEGTALGVFSCCNDAGGTITIRHSTIDVTKRAVVANFMPVALVIESSTLAGVSTGDVVAIAEPGGSITLRHSTVLGGGVGGSGAPTLSCRGTATDAGFLTTTCP